MTDVYATAGRPEGGGRGRAIRELKGQSNFLVWKEDILTQIDNYSLWGHLEGTLQRPQPPAEPDEARDESVS